jgi:hypothetical protein
MPGLVPGIHVVKQSELKVVDGRDEPGHDDAGLKFFWRASAPLRGGST